MDSTFERLARLLNDDELRHITPLKMLGLYREQMRVVKFEVGAEQGFLLLLPRAASQYDTAKYPSASLVIFPVLSRSPPDALIDECVLAVLKIAGAETFVIKSCDLRLVSALRSERPALTCERALLTFTRFSEEGAGLNGPANVKPRHELKLTSHIPPEAQALLAAHDVYSASELETMFADGTARCFLSVDGDDPVAIALAFPNTPTLHEIGSLYVAPQARRAGHASALVRAAMADLAGRNLAVRYVVDAMNAASIELAKQCGLCEVMRLEHWLSA